MFLKRTREREKQKKNPFWKAFITIDQIHNTTTYQSRIQQGTSPYPTMHHLETDMCIFVL